MPKIIENLESRLLAEAGFTPLTDAPYDDFEHYVEQAVHRDFVVARKD